MRSLVGVRGSQRPLCGALGPLSVAATPLAITLLLVFCLGVTLPVPTGAAYFLVEPSGNGLYPTIQSAIDAAESGDVVLLTNGVFTGVGNRNLDFQGKNLVLRSQSGEPAGCVLDPGLNGTAPSRVLVFSNGESPSAVVEGITLRGGTAPGPTGLTGAGGAVLCTNGSRPTFRDCVFEGNFAASDGGAVSARQAAPSFIGCVFVANGAPFGGALFADQPCLVTAGDSEEPPLVIDGCRFLSNEAVQGGAIYGRGVHTHLSITGAEMRSNFADFGGAMKLHGATATIEDSRALENWGSSEGGAFLFESTIFCDSMYPQGSAEGSVDVAIQGTLISGNFSGAGGAALVRGYSVSLDACTISDNIAQDASGIYARSHFDTEPFRPAFLSLTNTIVAFGVDGAAIVQDEPSTVVITCSDIFGNSGGDWIGPIADQFGVEGNLSVDPGFCDREHGDYSLRGDSPCQQYPGGCGRIGAFPAECAPASLPHASGEDGHDALRLRVGKNPFRGIIEAALTLPYSGDVTLGLHDVNGRRLAVRELGHLGAGDHDISWELGDRELSGSTGVLFFRLDTETGSATRKLIRVR